MSDDYSAWSTAAKLDGIWDSLATWGYALTDDESIGLPHKFRDNFGLAYFTPHILRRDEGDKPADRERARDVIRYRWRDGDLALDEFATIIIRDRGGIPGPREHARVRLLSDQQAAELVRALLSLVPPERRRAEGTFGVNFFRTHTNVVTTPHQDDEEFIVLYVVDRVGGGAQTYLYDRAAVPEGGAPTAEPILRQQLNPGQIIIFEDKLFKHGATPLEPVPGGGARRDALVCTVDYPGTYLAS